MKKGEKIKTKGKCLKMCKREDDKKEKQLKMNGKKKKK